MRFNMKFCIAAFRGNNSKISLEPQREVLSAAKRRGCWELRNPLSNFVRGGFSVTLEFAVTVKIDVTEKLSRDRDLIVDLIFKQTKQ